MKTKQIVRTWTAEAKCMTIIIIREVLCKDRYLLDFCMCKDYGSQSLG